MGINRLTNNVKIKCSKTKEVVHLLVVGAKGKYCSFSSLKFYFGFFKATPYPSVYVRTIWGRKLKKKKEKKERAVDKAPGIDICD